MEAVVRVCPLEELERAGVKVVAADGHTIAVFGHEGSVYALDNRCPHMGFPLHRGTVKDGMLTCHWHHAKFDLASGCTFNLFADDVPRFGVEVRDGDVWVDPHPLTGDPLRRWLAKLDEGLEQRIPLVLAKAVIGLDELGGTIDLIEKAALFGVRNRAAGWSSGLSILTAAASVSPWLRVDDRRNALYHGLVAVQNSTANHAPNFDVAPLRQSEPTPDRYLDWFRRFADLRAGEPAERTLRTAISIGSPPQAVAELVFAACTDHLFMGEGHSLDFANKAFELLDHIGWLHAQEVLSSLVPVIVDSRRSEEVTHWRTPVDVAALLFETYRELDALIERGGGKQEAWDGHRALAEQILDGEPDATLRAMGEAVADGVPLADLSATVAYAAARRAVHFPTTNEFGDWDSVHHTFTYASSVDQAMRRAPSGLLARGIFDGAMSVWIDRFLNVPKRPIPATSGRAWSDEEFLALFDHHASVEEAGQAVADLAGAGEHERAIQLLGHALLREDSGFHEHQILEAAVRQYENFAGRPEGDHVLIGAARFLAAHFPTQRVRFQTFDIATRLARGEALYGDEDQV